MAPRRGARSLKQVAQSRLAQSIILKNTPADVLNVAPTHLAVAVMKQVTKELEWTHEAAAARSSAMLKQKQCQLKIVERQLTAISRVFERIWRTLTQSEEYLSVEALDCDYQMTCVKDDDNLAGTRQFCMRQVGGIPHDPAFFVEEPVSRWGVEHWILSSEQHKSTRFADLHADYMIGQTLFDGRTGRKVTDPFL